MKIILDKSGSIMADRDGRILPVGRDGLNPLSLLSGPGPLTVLLHGYSFDPMTAGDDNPFTTQFPVWKRVLGRREYLEFGWYSVPRSFSALCSAWRSGHWTTYGWAWSLAEKTGAVLAELLTSHNGDINLVAHSLGSRVATTALMKLPADTVSRVIFWNGAEYVRNVAPAALRSPGTRFLNVICPGDAVLERLGDTFAPASGRCIGNDGLGRSAPENWTDIDLDDPAHSDWAEQLGTIIRGDNPYQIGDHWESYRYPGNWPLYRAFLNDRPPFLVGKSDG